jgi:hypothetical protein
VQRLRAAELHRLLVEFFNETDLATGSSAIAIRFMRIFSPCVLAIPRVDEIEKLAKEEMALARMKRDRSPQNVAAVSRYHDLSTKTAQRILDRYDRPRSVRTRRLKRDCLGQLYFGWAENSG